MPKAELEEEEQYKFEEDMPYRVRLLEVTEKNFSGTSARTNKEYNFNKWSWKFEVVEGDKMGTWAFGDTEDRLTTHPDNKVRIWAEALRGGQEFELGEGVDTDDLIGLECFLTFTHRSYEKNGETRYICDIAEAYPVDSDVAASAEPPF